MRVFFSYTHETLEHKTWVKKKADDLRQKGFETILDQDDLKFGTDISHFAEAAIESSTYVLLVCTPQYGAKANSRKAGAGEEFRLITQQLFNEQGKFIALLRKGDPEIAIPRYMNRMLYVDLRDDKNNDPWDRLCQHMKVNGEVSEIGTLHFEALFKYDPERIYDKPRLPELKRFTDFIKTGQSPEGRWYVVRRDPIKNDLATIFFQDPN